mgnify:CR=1 FL=1
MVVARTDSAGSLSLQWFSCLEAACVLPAHSSTVRGGGIVGGD